MPPSGLRDRLFSASVVIEPIFEADFQPCSYGFRPKRSATPALEAIREAGNRGLNFVVDADILGDFDNIQKDTLMELVKERISDRNGQRHEQTEGDFSIVQKGSRLDVENKGQVAVIRAIYVYQGEK